MATIRKYANGWRADIRRKGVRKTKTFSSKRDARDWAAAMETEILAAGLSQSDRTVSHLLTRYLEQVSVRKRGYKWERDRIGLLKRDRIAQERLEGLGPAQIADWRDRRLESVSGASVRREWNLLNHAFNVAIREWEWMRSNPMTGVRRPPAPPHRDRRISQDEIDLIVERMSTNVEQVRGRVCLAFLFAIETGMRASEVAGIRPANVAGRVVTLPLTKNGSKRLVALTTRAREILDIVGNDFRLTSSQISAMFGKYTSDLDLTYHDSRHEAITRLAGRMDVLDLARIVGIRDLKILMVYYNKSAEEIAEKLI